MRRMNTPDLSSSGFGNGCRGHGGASYSTVGARSTTSGTRCRADSATIRRAIAEWLRPKHDIADNGRHAGAGSRIRRAAGRPLRKQPADGLRQRAAAGRQDHHVPASRGRVLQLGQPGRPRARSGGAGPPRGPLRREPVVRNEPAVPLRRAAQVPAQEAVPEGVVRHVRGPAVHHRHREQPPGRLPPRRRQPDGTLLRVSDASVLGGRDRKPQASGSGPDRASSPLDRSGGVRRALDARRLPGAVSQARRPFSAVAGGRSACGNWSGRTSAT